MLDAFDEKAIARFRSDTAGCENVLHFNNAGASLMPRPVVQAVVEHLRLEESMGGYEAAEAEQKALRGLYASIARLIGGDVGDIAITANATAAWYAAFSSIPFEPGDYVVCSEAEYGSNYISFLHHGKTKGIEIEVIPNDKVGTISTKALEDALDRLGKRAKLVALTHMPTSSGLINPAAEVGRIAKAAGCYYLLDACQTVGQLPIDVGEIQCDFLSATGRKYLRGPRGTGFLYASSRVVNELEPVVFDLGGASWTSRDSYTLAEGALRFEAWEYSRAGALGLKAACDYLADVGIQAASDRIIALGAMLRKKLRAMSGISVHDRGHLQGGIVTFTHDGHTPAEIRERLHRQKINVTYSPITSARLELEAKGLTEVVRASLHYYNTEAEIEGFCAAMEELAR